MSDYHAFEIIVGTARPRTTEWDEVEWVDGPTRLGFEYGPAPVGGVGPAVAPTGEGAGA